MKEIVILTIPIIVTIGSVVTLTLLLYGQLRALLTPRNKVERSISSSVTFIISVTDDLAAVVRLHDEIRQNFKQYDIVLVRSSNVISRKQLLGIFAAEKTKPYVYTPRTHPSYAELIKKSYQRSKRHEHIVAMTTSHHGFDGSALRNLSGPYDAFIIPAKNDSVSYVNVMGVLAGSFTRPYRYLSQRIRTFNDAKQGAVHVLKAGALKSKAPIALYTSDAPLPLIRTSSPHRIAFTNNFLRRLCFLAAIVGLVVLAAAAIDSSGLEAFTFAWFTVAALGCVVVLFNSELTWRNRMTVFFCGGFIPLLLLLSILLIVRTSDVTP